MFHFVILIYTFIEGENCTCTGVKNEWGEGATCQLYSNYPDDYMNSIWCYAETATCKDATSVKFVKNKYVDEGHFGPSKKACSQHYGKIK